MGLDKYITKAQKKWDKSSESEKLAWTVRTLLTLGLGMIFLIIFLISSVSILSD